MSETPASPAAPRRRRRRLTAAVLIGLLVLVVGGVVTAWIYLDSLSSSYEENVQTFDGEETFPDEADRPEKASDDDSVNILLLGSDDRGGSGADEDLPRLPQGSRSDTMMLVHLPADRSGVQVMSVPRDLWVEVPGHGPHKINAPLTLGGLPLTIQTFEQLFDVRIDHVAAVDMQGFIGLVEALDGVEVESSYPEPFTTGEGYTFEPGVQQMDAEEALSFVRHRKTFPDGDLQRVRNQQAFIRGVLDEALSAGNLRNPGRVQDMVETFSPYLTVDESLDAKTVASLAWKMRGAAGSVDMFTLPTGEQGYSADGQWIWHQDEQAVEEVSAALKDDTLDDYIEQNDL